MNPHLLLLLVFSVAFLLGQIYLCWRAWGWSRLFENEVASIRSDIPAFGYEQFPKWFAPFVSTSKNSTHISSARDVALRQLEEYVAMQPHYLLLQKASVAAPLMGVVLTAFGFITLEGDLDSVKDLTIPLVSGVASGAILAFLNQPLLQLVENRLERSRRAGQSLVDDFWVGSVNQMGDPVLQMAKVSVKFDSTVQKLASLVGEFPKDVSELTIRFDKIGRVAERTFNELSTISPRLVSSVQTWANAAETLANATNEDLLNSLQSLKTGAGQLSESASQMEIAISILNATTGRFEATAIGQQKLLNILSTTVKSTLDDQSENFRRHIEKIRMGTDAIVEPIRDIASGLRAIVPGFNQTKQILELITGSSAKFSQVVDTQFVPARESMEKFEACATKLVASVDRLTKCLAGLEDAGRQHAELSSLLEKVVRQRALPTAELLQRATGTFDDSAHQIAECCHELSETIHKLKTDLQSFNFTANGDTPFLAAREQEVNKQ